MLLAAAAAGDVANRHRRPSHDAERLRLRPAVQPARCGHRQLPALVHGDRLAAARAAGGGAERAVRRRPRARAPVATSSPSTRAARPSRRRSRSRRAASRTTRRRAAAACTSSTSRTTQRRSCPAAACCRRSGRTRSRSRACTRRTNIVLYTRRWRGPRGARRAAPSAAPSAGGCPRSRPRSTSTARTSRSAGRIRASTTVRPQTCGSTTCRTGKLLRRVDTFRGRRAVHDRSVSAGVRGRPGLLGAALPGRPERLPAPRRADARALLGGDDRARRDPAATTSGRRAAPARPTSCATATPRTSATARSRVRRRPAARSWRPPPTTCRSPECSWRENTLALMSP